MLRRAARRRTAPAVSVKLMKMNLAELDFPDGFFDAAVASFVFCTMPRQSRLGLRELRRVVKPGGRIRLLEHAPAKTAFRRALTRMWQPWVDWASARSSTRASSWNFQKLFVRCGFALRHTLDQVHPSNPCIRSRRRRSTSKSTSPIAAPSRRRLARLWLLQFGHELTDAFGIHADVTSAHFGRQSECSTSELPGL